MAVNNSINQARNVQIFTATGAGTWTKPNGAKFVYVVCIGGGGGGATLVCFGGGGGGILLVCIEVGGGGGGFHPPAQNSANGGKKEPETMMEELATVEYPEDEIKPEDIPF